MKKLIFILVISYGAYYSWTHHSTGKPAMADFSAAQIQSLAASVKAEEITMYSTSECSNCHEAKGWLAQNGFAFTECNMSVDKRCESEFKRYGADGTPFLVIRRGGKEHLMRNGFDSDEFLAAL